MSDAHAVDAVIDVTSPTLPRSFAVGSGFSGREAWVRWTVGHVSSVVLAAEFPELDYVKILGRVYKSYSTNEMTIKWNNLATVVRITQAREMANRVACGRGNRRRRQYVQFIMPGASLPSRRIMPGGDGRVLGLALRRLTFSVLTAHASGGHVAGENQWER